MNEAQALTSREDFEKLDIALRKMIEHLAQGQSNLIGVVADESSAIQTHVTAEISKSRDELAEGITMQAKETRDGVSQNLNNLHLATVTEARRDKLLQSLKYSDMNQRKNMVKESFADTFKWIFSSDLMAWDSFTKWLRSDENLYWISGKPGSGKSTLVKFITGEEKTRDFLKPNTVILSHYLWLPGSPMQKSITGLLQSLLYQLLLEDISLVGLLLGTVKDIERKDHDSDWSYPELKSCLMMALSSSPQPICIFLDGLDEVSSSDGPFELMNLIEELSQESQVKICVASRPEPAYQKRYSTYPKLRLQDLTRKDIKNVCENSLMSLKDDIPDEWNRSRPGQAGFRDIIADLVEKAEGVFLWVHLALKSIQRGCSNSDSWEEILQRIQKLPAGLDELYHSMWERANVDQGIYEHGAALYLNLVLEAQKRSWVIFKRQSLSVFELMLTTEPSIQAAILDKQGQKPTLEDLKKRCDTLMKKIESHCAGLVEFKQLEENPWAKFEPGEWDALVPLSDMEVTFIHRTASDFLTETQGGKDILVRDTTSQADRLVKLLRGSMTQYTMWIIARPPDQEYPRQVKYEKFELDIRVFYSISMAIIQSRPTISESTAETLLHSCEAIWNARLPLLQADVPGLQIPDFLGHVTSWGFYDFVRARLEEAESSAQRKISQAYRDYLLHQASCRFRMTAPDAHVRVSNGKHLLVRWLLEEKADPSLNWFDSCSWLFPYTKTIWLTSPVMNLMVSGIEDLLELGNEISIQKLTQQSCDSIKQIMKANPIMDHKMVLYLNLGNSMEWVLFYPYDVVRGDIPLTRCILLEVNTLFMLQFFVELVRFCCPGIEDTDKLVPCGISQDADGIWSGGTKPLVRLIYYNPSESPDHDGFRPSSPSYIDANLVRRKLLDSLKYLDGESKSAEVTDGWLPFVAEIIARGQETIKTRSQLQDSFREYAFFSWPAPEEHKMEFPPAMF